MLKLTLLAILVVLTTNLATKEEDLIHRLSTLIDSETTNIDDHREEILDVIDQGLNQEDDDVIDLTLQVLYLYVDELHLSEGSHESNLRSESLGQLPRLKQRLFHLFHLQHSKIDFNTSDHISNIVEKSVDKEFGIHDFEITIVDDSLQDVINSLFQKIQDQVPHWLNIPSVACLIWRKDQGVYDFLWRIKNTGRDFPDALLLRYFNQCEFTTEETTAYRMEQLIAGAQQPKRGLAPAVRAAAAGLALNHPQEAIPHLIAVAKKLKSARNPIIVTLAGYSDEQLQPYIPDLDSFIRDHMRVDATTQRALNRLVPLVQPPIVRPKIDFELPQD